MTDPLRCPFCQDEVESLTLYLTPGGCRLLVCPACYALLVSKERQPYSHVMQRLHRLLGQLETEVMCDEGVAAVHGVDSETRNGSRIHRRILACVS